MVVPTIIFMVVPTIVFMVVSRPVMVGLMLEDYLICRHVCHMEGPAVHCSNQFDYKHCCTLVSSLPKDLNSRRSVAAVQVSLVDLLGQESLLSSL